MTRNGESATARLSCKPRWAVYAIAATGDPSVGCWGCWGPIPAAATSHGAVGLATHAPHSDAFSVPAYHGLWAGAGGSMNSTIPIR